MEYRVEELTFVKQEAAQMKSEEEDVEWKGSPDDIPVRRCRTLGTYG